MNNRIKTLNEAKEDNNVQKNKEAKEEFIKYIQNERKYSEYTVNNYHKDILEFETFLKENKFGNLLDPINASGRYYTSHLNEHYHKPRSVARKLSSLRSFYKFCIREGYTTSNPFTNVSSPKLDKTLPKFLYEEEIEILFDSIDTSTILGIRDYALLEFMYGTGVRVSELCSIKDTDIDYINHKVIVLGKGGKERYLPLYDLIIEALKNYLMFSRNELQVKNKKEISNILFLNNHGGPLTPRGVRDILNRIVEKASETFKISPHMIRHTFATHLLNHGADLISVQELLGHANLSTTQIYTHVSNEQLRREYMDKFPRAKREE